MFDIEGVSTSAGEEQRVKDALDALANDPHAPRAISVSLTLTVHREYPKHVTIGTDKDGNAITKIVNSKEEEDAAAAHITDQSVTGPALVAATTSAATT